MRCDEGKEIPDVGKDGKGGFDDAIIVFDSSLVKEASKLMIRVLMIA